MVKEFVGSVLVLIILLIFCWPAGLIYFVVKYQEVGPPMMMYGAPPPGYGAPPPGYYPPPQQGPPPPPYR